MTSENWDIIDKMTEVFILLDKSGSMQATWKATTQGLSGFIDELKTIESKVFISIATFSTNYDLHVSHSDLNDLNLDSILSIDVSGMTALNDSIMKSVSDFDSILEKRNNTNNNKIFMIITDGFENASNIYTHADIHNEITKRKDKNKDNWKFMFLGANIDAVKTADIYGINKDSAIKFSQNNHGINNVFRCASDTVNNLRKNLCNEITFTDLQRSKSINP